MTFTLLKNRDGVFVAPDDEAFKAAAAGADWNKSFYQLITDQPGKNAWPISTATFILMHTKQDKPANASETLKFFNWAFANGGKAATELDYVPMPADVIATIQKSWGEIKDASGKPIAFK
jgi:phosphate transport system substrate-binding protein